MLVDLVRVTTADCLRLDGALQTPSGSARGELPLDAALLVHGTGGSFYSSTMFEAIATGLLELGLAVLAINTRGHDLVSTAVGIDGPRRQGAAYEDVGRCQEDLSAWLDLLVARGYNRVVLLGHSLGAVKSAYSQAHQPHAAVARLMLLSPPRLSHAHFLASSRSAEFTATLAKAEALVAAGRGEELLDVRFPLPYLVTAEGYLDKYGPGERYSILPLIERLRGLVLLTFGSQEVQTNVAFAGLPEAVDALRARQPGLQVVTIAGADHFYSGCRGELVVSLERWLRREPAAG